MMRNLKVKLICICCLFMFMSSSIWAQINVYRYRSDLKKIDSTGIYKIELNPGLVAKSTNGLYDIRLFDNTGKSIAYALSNRLSTGNQQSFIEFTEVNPNAQVDTVTSYISDNANHLSIDQLWIKLKNTDVNRTISLTGSDDLQKWFAIKEDISLQQAGTAENPDYEQSIDFPKSNYRYFKIQINGKNKVPIKILRSGIYITASNQPEFEVLPTPKFNISDTGKKTSIFVHFGDAYQINKLHLAIAGPKYYSRRVLVYKGGSIDNDELADVILSSSGPQDIMLSSKTKQLRIDIFNGDDNPLKVTAITAYQLKQYAISYLESGHSYYILTGDSLAKPADYDLSFLKYCAINQLAVIPSSPVYKNPAYSLNKPVHKTDATRWLWASIIVVLIILSFLTLKMVREIE